MVIEGKEIFGEKNEKNEGKNCNGWKINIKNRRR